MIRDETVFVIGEEVARYNGAYKASLVFVRIFRPARLTDGQLFFFFFVGHQGTAGQVWRGPGYRREWTRYAGSKDARFLT